MPAGPLPARARLPAPPLPAPVLQLAATGPGGRPLTTVGEIREVLRDQGGLRELDTEHSPARVDEVLTNLLGEGKVYRLGSPPFRALFINLVRERLSPRFEQFGRLPEALRQLVLSHAIRREERGRTVASAQDVRSLSLVSRGMRGLVNSLYTNRNLSYDTGLSQLHAVRVHARVPNHGNNEWEQSLYEEEPGEWNRDAGRPRVSGRLGALPARFRLVPGCLEAFRQRRQFNAFCGVANLATGEICIYPLAPDAPEASRSDYTTTSWEGAARVEETAVVPIVHQADRRSRQGAVSHEVLSVYILRWPPEQCVGFSVRAEGETAQIQFVWSSRGLNQRKFARSPHRNQMAAGGGGHPTREVARAIVIALAEDLRSTWRALTDAPVFERLQIQHS